MWDVICKYYEIFMCTAIWVISTIIVIDVYLLMIVTIGMKRSLLCYQRNEESEDCKNSISVLLWNIYLKGIIIHILHAILVSVVIQHHQQWILKNVILWSNISFQIYFFHSYEESLLMCCLNFPRCLHVFGCIQNIAHISNFFFCLNFNRIYWFLLLSIIMHSLFNVFWVEVQYFDMIHTHVMNS